MGSAADERCWRHGELDDGELLGEQDEDGAQREERTYNRWHFARSKEVRSEVVYEVANLAVLPFLATTATKMFARSFSSSFLKLLLLDVVSWVAEYCCAAWNKACFVGIPLSFNSVSNSEID